MANNRAYLYCPICNEGLCIAKHFATAFDLRAEPWKIDSFFRQHVWCIHDDGMLCGTQIQLRYESTQINAEMPTGYFRSWEPDFRKALQEHREKHKTQDITRMSESYEDDRPKEDVDGESKNAPWIPKPSTLTRLSDHPERPE